MLGSLFALVVQAAAPVRHSAPPIAVDHVAIVEVERLYQPHAGGRKTVSRSGSWIWEQNIQSGVSGNLHLDLSSGVSVSYSRDLDGSYRSLSISRYPSTDTYHMFRRVRTDERDAVLGETCEIWSTTRSGEREGEGVNWLTCETVDGITL